MCLTVARLLAGFFAVLFDLDRDDFEAADFFVDVFGRALALLDFDRLDLALLDLLPMRPALIVVCTRL